MSHLKVNTFECTLSTARNALMKTSKHISINFCYFYLLFFCKHKCNILYILYIYCILYICIYCILIFISPFVIYWFETHKNWQELSFISGSATCPVVDEPSFSVKWSRSTQALNCRARLIVLRFFCRKHKKLTLPFQRQTCALSANRNISWWHMCLSFVYGCCES